MKEAQVQPSAEHADQKATLASQTSNRSADIVRIVLSVAGLGYLLAVLLNAKVTKLGVPEAIIFGTIVLFNSKLFANLAEMSISSKGIAFKVKQVEKKQLAQEDQIKALYWLIASVATRDELGYLEELAKDGLADYDNGDAEHDGYFKFELRRLRDRGLIEMIPSKTVKSMPVKGKMKDFCKITEDGRKYLTLRQKLESAV